VLPEPGQILFSVRLSSPNGKPLEAAKGRSGDMSFDQAAAIAQEEGGDLCVAFEGDTWTFLCRFPHRAEALAGRAESGAAVRAKQPARMLSTLVVEDEPTVRELVKEVLQGCGCRVETEADAATAFWLFNRSRHDVVLTDISMPGMDGLTLIRKLRAADPLAVVVVITGRITAESVKAAIEAGAKMVLPKPFDLAELRAIVDHVRHDPSGESLRRLSRAEAVLTGAR